MISKYKRMPNSVKASIWFMLCSILQKGITFLTIPIFTRLLSADQYGEYSLFLSWQEIISIFATLNLNYQVFNNGMIKFPNDKDGYTTSMVGLSIISSVFTLLILILFYNLWYNYTGIDFISLILMSINMLSLVVFGLWTVRKRFDYDYKLLTILTILMSILNPVIGIFFVKLNENKVLFRIISLTLSSLIFAIISLFLLLKKNKKIINLQYWKYALKLSIPLLPHYLSMVLLHSSDRIMIGKIIGKSATAFYSISYNVALVMQIIINSINASFIPWVYKRIKLQDYTSIKKYSNILILMVAIITTIPMFFAPEAVLILGGKEYYAAADIIPILSVSVFMIFFYSIFIIIEMFFEKSMYITFGSIMAALTNLFLNIIFINKFGYKAAAYTTLFSYVILAFFHYLMYKKICDENKIKVNIFDTKFMIFVSIILFVFSIVINFTYNSIFLRYFVLFIIIVVILTKKNFIMNTLKNIKKK